MADRGKSPHDIAALAVAYEDASAVIDHQIQHLSDIDDKTATVLRLDAILLGLILTAGSLIAQSSTLRINSLFNLGTGFGTLFIVVSLLVAVFTFNISESLVGIGPQALSRLIENRYDEQEWLILMLRSMGEWMHANETINRRNAWLLDVSLWLLALGVCSFVLGITHGLLG